MPLLKQNIIFLDKIATNRSMRRMGLVTWLVKVIRTSKGYLNTINYFQSQNCKQEMDPNLMFLTSASNEIKSTFLVKCN